MADYTYWQNALKGSFGPVHDSDPQPGFYRRRTRKGGPFVPVAIWEHEGKIVAVQDGKHADAAEIWTYVCQNPIPEDWYHGKMNDGVWRDEAPAVAAEATMGHNQGPTDEAEILKEQIESASAGVKQYEKIDSDESAAQAQSLRARLNELSGEADKKREDAKKPHLDAGKAIDAKWQPLVKAAKAGADAIRAALSGWETEKYNRQQEERRKAEEAQRKAEEKAAKAGKPAPAPPPPPEPAPEATQIKGAYGKAASVKVVKVVTVTDQDAAYKFLRTHPELVSLIAKLAQRGIDAGYDVPGVRIEEQRKVA